MRLILLVCALGLTACMTAPVAVDATSNPEINLQLLFEQDGCRVYRFWDAGMHYFARCSPVGEALPVTTRPLGKKQMEDVIIATDPAAPEH